MKRIGLCVLSVLTLGGIALSAGTAHADFFQGPYSGAAGERSDGQAAFVGFLGREDADTFNNVDFNPLIGETLTLTWHGRQSSTDIPSGFRFDFYELSGFSGTVSEPQQTSAFSHFASSAEFSATQLVSPAAPRILYEYSYDFDNAGLSSVLNSGSEYWLSITETDTTTDPAILAEAWEWADASDTLEGEDFFREGTIYEGAWTATVDDVTGRSFSLVTNSAAVPEPSSMLCLSLIGGITLYRKLKASPQ
ncbi:hypothetical protein OAK91_00690 [Planctomycetaceae bacterium]|nr:hypothetical protein [Planctomycetaceae bacterium]MDB4786649.1 hypothetical protein [Planctomycetaceae bacterium]MDC0273231.1 hypothetical protein [Planctomycetaceae bacterium]